MPRLLLRASLLIVVALFLVSKASPADDPQTVYKKATDSYKQEKYDSCSAVIRAFLKIHGNDSAAEYLVPLLIESSVRENDYALAGRLFQIYLKRYPSSVFMPRLWYLDGLFLAKSESYTAALAAFSNALSGGVAGGLDTLTLANVQKVCEKVFTADELDALIPRSDLHPRIAEVLAYFQIVKLFGAGQLVRAKEKAERYLRIYDRAPHAAAVRDYVNKAQEQERGQVQIGVMAPLSGYDADIGKQIVTGAQVAFDQYAASTGARLNLVTCDTRGNMIETAKKTKELLTEHHVPVILGPVLSQEAIVSASILMDKDAVMVSPTATDDGIAGMGPNIFQMNVTLATLGAKIARYAMDNLNIRDFAIIGPSSDYARDLARGFRREVEKSGREIVSEESYEEGTKDFKVQFDNLKTKLIMRKQQRTAVEKSLAGDAQPSPKTDPKLVAAADSGYEIGGIFLPAEAEDVVMLAPQVPYHHIRTQLLGSTGWHNPKTIADGREYVNNALLSSNLSVGLAETKDWQDFKALYKSKFGTDPDRVAALGYDAAALITQALRQAGVSASASQISQALASIKNYKGASGLVSFDPAQRINTEASIIKIKDKQFIRVQ
ncbi:MAG TPA: ABC transporter substrate-binding protein [Chitinivibrionales bacterium]|jgi:ABC-type branched-subunit amino acid transport system substrate-binding protein|nr:ABC transporter substrate-binding protein [Chitinivibrionales bacterium]